MYKNLIGEIAKSGISKKEISKKLNISHMTLARKLKGITDFTIDESKIILQTLNLNDFNYLFKKD